MNEYEKQANNFLHATGTKLTVELSEFQNGPLWTAGTAERYGKKYTVTLENPKGRYVFPYWDSIHNKEIANALDMFKSLLSFGPTTANYTPAQRRAFALLTEKLELQDKSPSAVVQLIRKNYAEYAERLKPTAYDILACLSLTYEDSFEDWADSFGYSTDSISARETYTACIEQDRQLRRLFTSEQLEKLEEIN